ncbi:MAG: lytic transglycosylase domain-containing protein [Candidatus Pacearchaeota archaeon]
MKRIIISAIAPFGLVAGLYLMTSPYIKIKTGENDESFEGSLEEIVLEDQIYLPRPSLLTQGMELDSLGKFSERRDRIYSLIEEVFSKKKNEIPHYLDKDFFRWVVFIESGDDPHAYSPRGARGLMQITYSAWNQVEKKHEYIKHVYDPQKNIEVGIKYFIWLDEYCKKKNPEWGGLSNDKKRDILLGAYNGGVTRLFNYNWDVSKMPDETREYVLKISKRNNDKG